MARDKKRVQFEHLDVKGDNNNKMDEETVVFTV